MTTLPLSYAEGCKKRNLASLDIDKETWEGLSLVDKWKTSYRNEYVDQSIRKYAEFFSIGVFWFTCVTELFTFIVYIIPGLLSDYSVTHRMLFSVFVTFVFIQATGNWLFTYFVKSDFPKQPHFKAPPGGYRKCHVCDINQPPRTHHCKVCDTCIKKRDHHCFFAGSCVGFWNQRYFVVMNFHVAGASIGGLIFTYLYLVQEYKVTTYWDYFLPMTIYNVCQGISEFQFAIMMVHMYSMWFTGGMALFFFTSQIYAISSGRTTYEIQQGITVKSLSTVSDNFRSVFGRFWMLNFFLPTQFIWMQEGDGIHWEKLQLT